MGTVGMESSRGEVVTGEWREWSEGW